ncbi:MAG: polysaccharide deacetylase family protein [Anaerolineales bacterium]|nr:polysaccharide deacetylase family protein [Anaerolineales bacterium]
MKPNPVLKKLGFADDERVAIIHVDDVGMCQASIAAFAELDAFGLVSCGAVMMPCPWSLEAAKFARQNPDADLGVHLTLTSEWETYRWGPLSTRDPQSGLVDEEGYFYHLAHQAQEHADPEAAGREIVAQIEAAKAAGIDPTHADTHMGTLAHPKLMQSYIQLAIQQQVPPMMLRLDEAGWRKVTGEHTGAALDEGGIGMAVQMVQTLEEMGVPLLDAIEGLPLDSDPALRLEHAKQAFDALKPGITHFIIHAAKDTPELRAITPDWACRAADYETFLKEELRQHLHDSGVQVIGYRPLKELMAGVTL